MIQSSILKRKGIEKSESSLRMRTKDYSNSNFETRFERTNKDGGTSYERVDTQHETNKSPHMRERTNKDISLYKSEITEIE
jgi:hypothetical protein